MPKKLTPADVFPDAPAVAPRFALIPIATIALSDTDIQRTRRAHFRAADDDELAENIRAHGVMQPVLVRAPDRRGRHELIAGERRVLAARKAGLVEIPAMVHTVTDLQVAEMQIIENAQRYDLHPMVEAEGYEVLMRVHSLTVADIAAKVARSTRHVQQRLRLCTLCPEVREAFHADKIGAAVAYLIARLDDRTLQRDALKEIESHPDTPTVREVHRMITDEFMLDIAQAPFDIIDPTLLPEAGRCSTCPKRTSNQTELFADLQKQDLCTDRICWGNKREAHLTRQRAEIVASGRTLITGEDAKKLFPHEWDRCPRGYVLPDSACYEDGSQRTYREVLGEDAQWSVIEDPRNGELIEAILRTEANNLLRQNGIITDAEPEAEDPKAAKKAAAEQEKQEIEREVYERALRAVAETGCTILSKLDMEIFVRAIYQDDEGVMDMLATLEGECEDWVASQNRAREHVDKLLERGDIIDMMRFVRNWALHCVGSTELMTEVAKEHNIDLAAIRKQVKAERKGKK